MTSAAAAGKLDMLELLQDKGIPFDKETELQYKGSVLSLAAGQGDTQLVEKILAQPHFDMDLHFAVETQGQSALAVAAFHGQLRVIISRSYVHKSSIHILPSLHSQKVLI